MPTETWFTIWLLGMVAFWSFGLLVGLWRSAPESESYVEYKGRKYPILTTSHPTLDRVDATLGIRDGNRVCVTGAFLWGV